MAAAIDMRSTGGFELVPEVGNEDSGRLVSIRHLVDRARESGRVSEAFGADDWTFMADTIDRQARQSYNDAVGALNISYETIGFRRDTKSFEQASDHDIYGENLVPEVPQGANYPGWDAADREFTARTKKYGRTWKLPMEAILRDDVDLMLLRSQPLRWGFAARYTMEYLFTASWAGETSSFFTAGNSNYVDGAGTALGETSLNNGILQMRSNFTDPSGNIIPYAGPLYLVVPPALEKTAKELMESEWFFATTASKTPSRNVLQGSCKLVVNHFLPTVDSTQGTTAWYLFADPRIRPAVRYGYVQGMEQPQIFVRETDARSLFGGGLDPINVMFENDSIEFKLRFTFGADNWDPRGAYMAKGAA